MSETETFYLELDGERIELKPRIVITEGFERLFSHYTGLTGEELVEYVRDFQLKALRVFPYPCIANGGFAAVRVRAHNEYNDVIELAKKGGQLVVDLGCCLGTDIRELFLSSGGADRKNKMVGVDLRQEYLDLGEELFKGPTPDIEFRAADLMDPTDTRLDDIKGKVTILYTGAVFHLFDEQGQRAFAEAISRLLAPEGSTVVFGVHRGVESKGPFRGISRRFGWAHDPESWKQMWREVLGEDAKNWEIKGDLRTSWTPAEILDESRRVLQWSLWRE